MSGAVRGTGGLAGLSVRRPYLAAVVNLLIVIAGLGAWFGIETRALPSIEYPTVLVRGTYPGASPETVDAAVTSVLEKVVARVNGLQHMSAASEQGNFRINASFDESRPLNDVANDVREAVLGAANRLPDEVEGLRIFKADRDAASIFGIAITADGTDNARLSRLVEDQIVPLFSTISGVAEVRVWGGQSRVLRVAVSPARLAAHGISVGEVAAVLRAAEFDVPVGSFEADQLEVLVRADATVSDPERIGRLMLRDPVRLRDVADVYFGAETRESFSRLNGREIVALGIVRQPQSNTVEVSDAAHAALERLRARYPELRFTITKDDAVFIRGALSEVVSAQLAALAIVIGVIWLFLGRLGATLVPAVTIPVALIGALGAMWLMGFSLNLVTMLALVLATGLVVDDAIVVTENIHRCRQAGMAPRAAAVIGTRQVFFAVIATTLTLVAVFLPISFLPSATGKVFTEFGFVLCVTVILSSFVALTACPMIASRLQSLGRDGGAMDTLGRGLARVYGSSIVPSIRLPLVVVTVALLIAGGAVVVHGELGVEVTPREDRGTVQVRLFGPDGTGLDYTDRQVARAETLFERYRAEGTVVAVRSITGRWDANIGEVTALLAPWDRRALSQQEIQQEILGSLQEIAGARARLSGGNSLGLWRRGGGGLSFAVIGGDYPSIAAGADALAERMTEIPGLGRGRVQYQATQPQLAIQIDRARVADLEVSMEALSTTLRALIDEMEVTSLIIGDEDVPVFLQSSTGAVRDPADLLNLSVRAESGALVPLTQLLTFREEGVAGELDRQGQRRAVEVYASLSPELSLAEAVTAVRALAEETLPPDLGILFLNDAQVLEKTNAEMRIVFAIALAVVFLVLVAQFESVTSALVIMLTVPFGIAAAIYAMWLTDTTINVFSQIGILMLVGIMAKNGILLVEFADQLRDRGAPVWAAAREAACARLRPISMTLVSTVLAGLPLILAAGPGAEGRAAIGWVVFGGLGLGALVTLFVTPATYVLVAGLSKPRQASSDQLDAELDALQRPAE